MNFKSIILIVLTLFSLKIAQAQEEAKELMNTLTTELNLSDVQQKQMKAEIIKFRNSVERITILYANPEETEVGVMVAGIRESQQDYQDKVEAILDPDQHEKYSKTEDQVMTDMFNDLASTQLKEVQPDIELTDSQCENLTPIMGIGMKKTMSVLYKNAGLPLTRNRKLEIAKELKLIEKEKRESMKKILTPDQLAMYDSILEDKKNKL